MPEKRILTSDDDEQTPTFTNKDGFIPISRTLNENDSNFIFSFGESQIGKSVIIASMIYHMYADGGTLRPKQSAQSNQEAEILLYDMLDGLKRGKLPKRTAVEQVTRLDFVFDPKNKSKTVKPINLTFLEMSGEDLQQVRRGGALHKSIDDYLNAEIPINFFLVTDYENATNNDALMISFLRKIESERRKYKSVNAILIITKWDKSGSKRPRSEEEFETFLRENMPLTNGQINANSLFRTYYTVGDVETDEEGNSRITNLNLDTAKNLTEWLYYNITGVDINCEGTFWERLKESLFG
jgi:hypothetical protein